MLMGFVTSIILFDAGQVLQARIIQAQINHLDGIDELREIRRLILDLRKAKSEL